MINCEQVRKDTPILHVPYNGKQLIYLDSAATSQKPQVVIDALTRFYTYYNAPIARGVYDLAEQATILYEQSRARIAQFLGAHAHEIVFTKGATEGINIVAWSWAVNHIKSADTIIITDQEHHSNILVWQAIAKRTGAHIKFVPLTDTGDIDLEAYRILLDDSVRLVAFSYTSNVLGSHAPVKSMIELAHAVGAVVLIDGAQTISHIPIDLKKLEPDFFVCSAHKMGGPAGIGALYISERMHKDIIPYHLGGGMVEHVERYDARFRVLPYGLEAGSQSAPDAYAWACAIDYFKPLIDSGAMQNHSAQLCAQLITGLKSIPEFSILGNATQLASSGQLVSFVHTSIHAHDIAAYLDQFGICVRAGHHCAQPLAQTLGIASSVRASFFAYNTFDEVAYLIDVLARIHSAF
ncbi:cysteine desulfurase [Vermiphilus pyriformis]|nr:MAG: cysteine desulfurase [Vermiphilus pyriformis]